MKNIDINGKIVESERPDLFSPKQLKEIVFDSLNTNEYVFNWEQNTRQPYSGKFYDGEKIIDLFIYVWNITPTHINNNPTQKGIQIRSTVDNTGLERQNTDTEKTLLLGVYNCPKQPIIAAWDSWHYRNHFQNTCYIEIGELKEALNNSINKFFHGCNVYTMTAENLPVYVAHMNANNQTDLETPSGNISAAKVKKERKTNAKKRYINNIEKTKEKINGLSETEKEAIVKARVGQELFRELLITKYGCKCALCDICIKEMLVASHIKRWSKCNDQEKLDENNGLLLCTHHDALFDKFFISFKDDGSLITSSRIDETAYDSLGINEIPNIEVNENMREYLRWHRSKLE